jgi:hypothetical protein
MTTQDVKELYFHFICKQGNKTSVGGKYEILIAKIDESPLTPVSPCTWERRGYGYKPGRMVTE